MVKRIALAVLIIGLVAGGVIATGSIVKAQAGTTTNGNGPVRPFDQFLAEELGITVERLFQARQKAAERALDQALADGKITQDQYNHMKTMQALRAYIDPQTILAEALGVSVDELHTKTLREWMDEKGLDRATLKQNIETALKAKLEQAVKDGVITQEQLDELGEDFFMRGLWGGLGRGRGEMPGFPGRGRGGRMGGPGEGMGGMFGPGEGFGGPGEGFGGPGDCFEGGPLNGDDL